MELPSSGLCCCSILNVKFLSAERICSAVAGFSQWQVHSGGAAQTGRTWEEPDWRRQWEGTRGIQRSTEGQSFIIKEYRGTYISPTWNDLLLIHATWEHWYACCSDLRLCFLQVTSPQWQNLEQRESYQRLVETVSVLHRLARRLSSRAELVGAVRQVRPCRWQKRQLCVV